MMGLKAGQAQSTNRRLQFPGLQASQRLAAKTISRKRTAASFFGSLLYRPRCRHCTSPAAAGVNQRVQRVQRLQRLQGWAMPWASRERDGCASCWKDVPARPPLRPLPHHPRVPASTFMGCTGKTWIGAERTGTGSWWTYHFHFLAIMTSVPGQGHGAEAPAVRCVTQPVVLHSLLRAVQQATHAKGASRKIFPHDRLSIPGATMVRVRFCIRAAYHPVRLQFQQDSWMSADARDEAVANWWLTSVWVKLLTRRARV